MNQYFFEAVEGLDRWAPGSSGSTLFAMRGVSRNEEISILEIGCGRGTSSLLLAKAYPRSRIIAVDTNQDAIRALGQRATQEGLSQQVQGMVMDMKKLQFPQGQFDVILCEASVYQMGFAEAVEDWKKFLRVGGQLIVSDLCWLKTKIARPCRTYWDVAYPEMTHIHKRIKEGEGMGYACRSHHLQPASDWIEGYYKPLQDNLEGLMKKYPDVPEVQEVVKEFDEEMKMYAMYAASYGYVVFVFEKS